MELRPALRDWTAELLAAEVPAAAHDARALVAHVVGGSIPELALCESISVDQQGQIQALVDRRAQREPLQHLTGLVGFFGVDLRVGPGVFVPRPETELLAEWVCGELAGGGTPSEQGRTSGDRTVVDLCSGSGALAIAIAARTQNLHVIAVELSEQAAGYASRNVALNAVKITQAGSRVTVVQADIADWLAGRQAEELRGTVAAVVSNPPYIPAAAVPREPEVRNFDPPMALYGGDDGLDTIRDMLPGIRHLLAPSACFGIEHADLQGWQRGGVPDLVRRLPASGDALEPAFWDVRDHRDLAGRPRFTTARSRGPVGAQRG